MALQDGKYTQTGNLKQTQNAYKFCVHNNSC
jgi:hypothetical protein